MFSRILRYFILIIISSVSALAVYAADAGDNQIGYQQKGNFEIGGGFGTPSGLNARYWFTEIFGLDVNTGISLDKNPVFTADFLIEEFKLYRSSTWESRFFFGFGALFSEDDDEFKNNLRVPIGLSFPMVQYPVNFSIYVAPAYVTKPKHEFEINWGIGVRYNFGRASDIKERQYRLERDIGRLENDIESLKHGLYSAKGQLAETEGKLSDTRGRLAQKEGELSLTKEKLDELGLRLSDLKSQLGKTEGELDTTKTKLVLTTKQLDDAKNQLDNLKTELKNTKKNLDDKQFELNKKQTELDNAKIIIENALVGKERKDAEEKIAKQQKELDALKSQLNDQKQAWEKIKQQEAEKREDLKKKCADRGGVIDDNGYCTCPENQEWDPRTDTCVCVKGYFRNNPGERCMPCEVVKQNGECAGGGCENSEQKVRLTKGPHKYVCVKRCSKRDELWSNRKGECVCRDGYYRSNSGECQKRQ